MRKLFLIIISAIIPLSSAAQLVADTTLNSAGFAKALSYYTGAIGINASIYSGSENADPRFRINEGFAFYGSPDPVKSELLYDGVLYREIPLWYDIAQNELAVMHPVMHARIALNNRKVEYFKLGDHPFVPADRGIPGSEKMPDIFYEVLYQGKAKLLGGYSKKLFEVIKERQYVSNYGKQESEYYLQKDGRYQSIRKLSDLLDILSDKKQELQQHLRAFEQTQKDSKIRIKETLEQSLVRVLGHYEKIGL